MPRISILLTCYNHLAYLPACAEGVRAQTFQDFEVIALDDGSTDGTRDWLAEHAADWSLVFNERNLGTYGTLNVGLAKATGEFVAVLNDDDLWAPGKLAAQLALMDAHPEVGLVHTDGGFINREGKPLAGSPLGFAFPRTETGNVLADLLYQNKIIASAVLARRACFEALGGFNEAYFGSGDWEMWLRIAERWDVGFVDEPLTFYRVHGENASHKLDRIWRDDERLRDWIETRAEVYARRVSDAPRLRKAMAHNAACLGTVRTLNGDPAGGRRAYALSIRREPARFKSWLRWIATFLPRAAFRRFL
ncbi:MAG: glycosyltransferase [Fimbriimonadaceae bacterium]|nr:glycosyltransferase [Chthonomonadaceae bacterium]MCO5298196.1 glycosyltransferase [Fimbriimonadaceae bacterium]